jgi:O-antigen/teichoic acid export membrane protein
MLVRNSLWMFLGYGCRIMIQAGYFVLIARALGVHEYGAFVGATALVSILSPFSGLGAGNLLIKNVSRDTRCFAVCWGNTLLLTFFSGLPVLALLFAIARFTLPSSISWSLIALVGVSDILALRLVDIAGQAFQAFDHLRFTAQLNLMPNVLRLLGAAIVMLHWHRASAGTWAWFYFASSGISALIGVAAASWSLGLPKLEFARIRKELLEGFYFSVSLSSQTIYNDIDKTMLARLSTLDATGIYAAAYRLIDVAFTPVRSVLYAAYPTFFRHGQHGIEHSYAYAKKLLKKMAIYSVAVFLGMVLLAPIIPMVIGNEYARTVIALRWLALLPLLKTIHYFLADSLTGAGFQGYRTAGQVLTALMNVVLNLWLIPAYSWVGAA